MNRIPRFILIAIVLFVLLLVSFVALFIFLRPSKGVGPYQEYIIEDVSKPQQFIIPGRFINPVVIRYRIEGVIDKSAIVSFQTETAEYVRIPLKGVVADSAVQDFYENKDMLITYQPIGTKKGNLVIKAALDW
jgi:hypothetical protein